MGAEIQHLYGESPRFLTLASSVTFFYNDGIIMFQRRNRGASFVLFIAVFVLSFSVRAENPSSQYDELFQNGLKAEAAKNWSDAIQFYLKAQSASPQSPWPKGRIVAILKELTEKGQTTDNLVVLLPQEMQDDFLRSGVLKANYDEKGAIDQLNLYIWGGIVAFILLIGGTLAYFIFHQKKQEEHEAYLSSIRTKPRAPAPSSGSATSKVVSPKQELTQKKDMHITEDTRNEISGIFQSITSVQSAEIKEEEVDVDALHQSGVLEALAQTMISEVQTEDAKEGRFSKMTVEAALLFDESDFETPKEEEKKS